MGLAVVLAAWPAVASGGTPVRLPPGEDASAWHDPLAMAELELGEADSGPWVVLEEAGGGWRLRVLDASGTEHQVPVAQPLTPGAREDIAWLAASLLHPLGSLSGESGAVVVGAEEEGEVAAIIAHPPPRR